MMDFAFIQSTKNTGVLYTTLQACLAMFKRNKNKFLHRFITMDETWDYTIH